MVSSATALPLLSAPTSISTSETDEMMTARTELRGAPRSTESRNADTPPHGSYSLSNSRSHKREGEGEPVGPSEPGTAGEG